MTSSFVEQMTTISRPCGEFSAGTDSDGCGRVSDHNTEWTADLRALEIFEVYYLAPIDNLSSILTTGILPHNEVAKRNLSHIDISLPSVQQRRSFRGLHDFVPLYFACKTPMSYKRRD